MPKLQGLNEKQLMAAHLFVAGKSKSQAMIMAGFKDRSRSVALFKDPMMLAEIEKIRELARKEVALDVKDVIAGFMDGVAAAQNTADLVMAWREIGKIIGAYEHAKKVEIEVKHTELNNVKQIEALDDEALEKLADLGEGLVLEHDEIRD